MRASVRVVWPGDANLRLADSPDGPGGISSANTSSLLGKGSLMSVRRFRRHSATAVALAGLLLTTTGCNDSSAEPEPLPPSSSTPITPSSPTTSPTPTPSGWESEFTEEQLAEYEAALGRWEDYQRESEPIWANPHPTAETLKFFARYFYNEDLM